VDYLIISVALLLFGAAFVLLRRAVRACRRAARAQWGNSALNVLDGLNRIFCRRFHRLQGDVVALPASGPAIVASNHLSGLDPLLMIASCGRPLRFMIAREQFQRWWLKWLFGLMQLIPVERSTNPEKALYAARRALDAGEVVAIFPQGRIHLDSEEVGFKRGVVLLAALSGAPIYPLRIDGVAGAGRTVTAVFQRSRARVKAFPPLRCTTDTAGETLHVLERTLAPREHAGSGE